MNADPNWLPSSIMQGSAALLAIVFSYLLARHLQYYSESRRQFVRLRTAYLQVEYLEGKIDALAGDAYDEEMQDLLDFAYQEMVDAKGNLNRDQFAKDLRRVKGKYDDEVIVDIHARADKYYRDLYSFVDSKLRRLPTPSLDEIQDQNLELEPPFDRDHIERVFDNIQDEMTKDIPANLRLFMGLGKPFRLTQGMPSLHTPIIIPQSSSLPDVRRQLDATNIEAASIHEELRALEDARTPAQVLWTSLIFAILGIVVPLVGMPMHESRFTHTHQAIYIGVFLVGLAVLAYGFLGIFRQRPIPKEWDKEAKALAHIAYHTGDPRGEMPDIPSEAPTSVKGK